MYILDIYPIAPITSVFCTKNRKKSEKKLFPKLFPGVGEKYEIIIGQLYYVYVKEGLNK